VQILTVSGGFQGVSLHLSICFYWWGVTESNRRPAD
jgi:hypothetical protein